jgi:hypothetical protein
MSGPAWWHTKIFKTKEAKDKWIERHGHRYQIQEIFVNNAWGLEVRKLRMILGGR